MAINYFVYSMLLDFQSEVCTSAEISLQGHNRFPDLPICQNFTPSDESDHQVLHLLLHDGSKGIVVVGYRIHVGSVVEAMWLSVRLPAALRQPNKGQHATSEELRIERQSS